MTIEAVPAGCTVEESIGCKAELLPAESTAGQAGKLGKQREGRLARALS